MYDKKWDGQSTHQCSSWHQKQTTGRDHWFESHNSLGSESPPARCSPLGAFALLPTERFDNLTFHYRPAVWHATIATLVNGPLTLLTRSRDMDARSTGTKIWEQSKWVARALYASFLQRRLTNSSLTEFTRQTFGYSRWGRTTGREHKLTERFDIRYKYKTNSWHLNGFLDGSNIGSTV